MGNVSTGNQFAGMHHLELAFLDDVAPKYLSLAQPPHGLKIRQWKNRSAVPLINKLHSGLSGLKRQQATVLDHDLVWLEGGNPDGKPVVLLHGFASNKENWLSLVPFLLKQHRLFVLDLPGWGESQFNANVPYGLDDQVARVAAWIQAHVPGRAHVVGNSVGGLVSALLAGRHGDLIQTLCLMNPAGGKGSDHTHFEAGLKEGRNPMIVESLAGAHTLMSLAIHNRAIALALAPVMAQDLINRRHVNRHLFHQMFVNAPNPNGPGMSATTAPTLIMWGKEDRLVHYTGAYTYQAIIPHADVVLFDGVGHLPMVEIPIRTAKALQEFWSV
ncbi:MAG: alpha/beta fold hydrolase [Gammaproteobacteria bacterium]|uniref:alpha/beta fold hydrolase n=1 Tax=Limnobacter sp. TaxID=2003368 RepID=UPI001DD88DCF|nr:alpha/beta fold hydrolase [Limnobacter sp.]MBU0784890.1 alpha/beta fold hydrolase [Gammaproteobacteria bacterium]MBU0848306.1 alpha/beta fold hydrolase [Gammaproteobacteria bacterium]MBU1266999.1 alpha/beta fold hydrolase [Gammaproteobacteria bacterium]MBU1529560.1 alpha/beta fold hydrolase [Gammaproteobacteria bacterium]MBU1781141.1 alpha/beta fold hydrolase [Gammaproteobacteria bacterium]